MYAAPSNYEHRNPDWIAELRKVAGIPADAPINLMRDYGVLGTKGRLILDSVLDSPGQRVLSQWTGGYIADWYEQADVANLDMESEQEVIVQNVPVKVRKWVSRP